MLYVTVLDFLKIFLFLFIIFLTLRTTVLLQYYIEFCDVKESCDFAVKIKY